MRYQSNLRLHNEAISRAAERLSTGSRINQSKDDPFRNYEMKNAKNEIQSGAKARQNSLDAASLLQIAEGTCGEVQNILQRIRELAVQSANDTLTSIQRSYINIEAEELFKEVNRIAANSQFNEKQIFGEGPDSFSSETRAGVLHIGIDSSIGEPNDANKIKVKIPEISARTLLGREDIEADEFVLAEHFSLMEQNSATKAIDDLDAAMSSLSTIRSYMGSLVNRLEMQTEYLDSRNINHNDHVTKISDTDFAKESTEFASAQIKQQAAISILTQSNSRISKVMDILGW
jgi:flagellin